MNSLTSLLSRLVSRPGGAARLVGRAGRFIWQGSIFWLGSGRKGSPRPRMPKRHGHGPYHSAHHYFPLLAFYPLVLIFWVFGATCRRRSNDNKRILPIDKARHGQTVHCFPILTVDECISTCQRIAALRDRWILRQPGFYTLGRAAYLDCRDLHQREQYFNDVLSQNDTLLHSFQDVYAILTQTLERYLGAPCRVAEQYAIPGFHVWEGRGIPHHGFDAGSVHFDLQYLDLGLYAPGWPTIADVFSFTLPLRLPKAGAALNIWDIRYPESAGWEKRPYTLMSRVPYSVGSLVLHTGHELHQIAPIKRVGDEDQRICLQGHGIRRDGIWLLYW